MNIIKLNHKWNIINVFNFVAKNNTNIQRIFDILRYLKQLYLASDLLHRHFSTILMVNCFVTFLTMLTSAYYVIEFIPSGYVPMVFLDSSDVVDSFIRFWLICHTSDLIRETVNTFTIYKYPTTAINHPPSPPPHQPPPPPHHPTPNSHQPPTQQHFLWKIAVPLLPPSLLFIFLILALPPWHSPLSTRHSKKSRQLL